MAFTRTPHGLENMHKFYGTDYIVYVEGGQTQYTFDQVIKYNKVNDSAIDIAFWGAVFVKFGLKFSYIIKAVGSKTTALEIAKVVVSQAKKCSRIIVAMDRDYDFINKVNIKHPRVIYTYGYSWENDLWQKNQVVSLIKNQLCVQQLDSRILNIIEENYLQFSVFLRRFSILQYLCNSVGIEFLPMNRLQSIFQVKHNNICTNRVVLNKSIKIAKSNRDCKIVNGSKVTIRENFDISGKVHKEFSYLLLGLILKKKGKGGATKDFVESMMVSFCKSLVDFGFSKRQISYYSKVITNLNNSVK